MEEVEFLVWSWDVKFELCGDDCAIKFGNWVGWVEIRT